MNNEKPSIKEEPVPTLRDLRFPLLYLLVTGLSIGMWGGEPETEFWLYAAIILTMPGSLVMGFILFVLSHSSASESLSGASGIFFAFIAPALFNAYILLRIFRKDPRND